MDSENKINDLKHRLLEEKIETMNSKMHEGFYSIKTTITKGFELQNAENKRQNDISKIQRDNILAEQKRTNGRITRLEEVTSVIKLMRQNKKITGLVLYAVYNILEISTIENVLSIYKWIKLMI